MSYTLDITQDTQIYWMRRWLILAIFALTIAGICSLPPAILRGPFFEEHFNTQYIFDIALVVHVNCSVLVWFLALIALLWSARINPEHSWLTGVGFYLSLAGIICLIIPLFSGTAIPLKSNYIPMLYHPVFALGLALLFAAFTLLAFLQLIIPTQGNPIATGLRSTAIIILVSFLTFGLSAYYLSSELALQSDPLTFFELLFNGGGHLIQFAYSNLMLLAWFWLASVARIPIPVTPSIVRGLFILNAALVVPMPLTLFIREDLIETFNDFTQHMRIAGGIVPVLAGILVFYGLLRHYAQKHPLKTHSPHYLYASLICSILFFAYGGLLAFMITGMNTIVPAHYHATVVGGISIAGMGLAYHLLPVLGFAPAKPKLAAIQPYLYTAGHFLHVTGLALMGGYGALRKTAASTDQIDTMLGKILFFTGAPLSLAGGLLFIVIMLIAMVGKNNINEKRG